MTRASGSLGRKELVAWVNSIIDTQYKDINDVSNGAAFCQLVDAMFPGSVPISRVDFNAQLQHQRFSNYKILQEACLKNGIDQAIDVATLSKGQMMATLELLQWIHGYYEQTGPHPPYDPSKRRTKEGKIRKTPSKVKVDNYSTSRPSTKGSMDSSSTHSSHSIQSIDEPVQIRQVTPDPALKAKIKTLTQENKNLKEEMDEMYQERDFYYDKLRRIEDFCREHEDEEILQQVLEIVYEQDEENGFVSQNQ